MADDYGRSEGEAVHIEIVDNGRGIEPEELEEINNRLQLAETSGESFGIRSVHERLKLTYGSAYGMDIQSEPDAGTVVTVKLPIMKEGEERDV